MADVTKVSNNNASDENIEMLHVAFEEIYKNLREIMMQLLKERNKVETLQKQKVDAVKKQEQLEEENAELKTQVEQLQEMQNQVVKLEIVVVEKCCESLKKMDKIIKEQRQIYQK